MLSCTVLLALLSIFFTPAYPALLSTGATEILNGVAYYVPAAPVTTLQGPWLPLFNDATARFLPMTVATTDKTTYSAADLSATTATYSQQDDVWQDGFLQSKKCPTLSLNCLCARTMR